MALGFLVDLYTISGNFFFSTTVLSIITSLVYVELPTNRHIHNGRDEFLELAKSSGLNVIKDLKVTRNNAKAKYCNGLFLNFALAMEIARKKK
jgi:hypothetical protein